MTAAWIDELTLEERGLMEAGVLLGPRKWKLDRALDGYQKTLAHLIEQQSEQPSPVTQELIEQLTVRAELIIDEIRQIDQREQEWRDSRPQRECGVGEHEYVDLPNEGPTAKRCRHCSRVTGHFWRPDERPQHGLCRGSFEEVEPVRRGGLLCGRCRVCGFECVASDLQLRDRPPAHQPRISL